jgi:hypothetical protein
MPRCRDLALGFVHAPMPLTAVPQIISDEQGYLTSRLGTVNYMAPEIMARQVRAQRLLPRSV